MLKLSSSAEGHWLPELSRFSAPRSIFTVELAAPCQGFLPQIELLERPTGFLGAFRHLFTFRLASLPQPQKGISGASRDRRPPPRLCREPSGVARARPTSSNLAAGTPAAMAHTLSQGASGVARCQRESQTVGSPLSETVGAEEPPRPSFGVPVPSEPPPCQVPPAPTCPLRQDLRTHHNKCHGQVTHTDLLTWQGMPGV